jgi:hypothetical protein
VADEAHPIRQAMNALLGTEAVLIVAPAVPPTASLRRLKPYQVLYRPRRRVIVTYEAVMEWPDGAHLEERLVAMVDSSGLPEQADTSVAGGQPAAVWLAPQDPLLPGLRLALNHAYGTELLRAAGVPARTVKATLRAYRPGRRAVVEVRAVDMERPKLVFSARSGELRESEADGDRGPSLYLKVLRPEDAAEVAATHDRLAPFVPVAPCTLVEGPGILRLGALAGRSLGSGIRRGSPPLPPPDQFVELLDRLQQAGVPEGEVWESDDSLRSYRRLLRDLVPEEVDRIEELTDALSGARLQPIVSVHGDFHEGNILVGDEGVTGLLDVDDAGPGELVEDFGLLVGRIWSLSEGSAGERALRYTDDLLRRFDEVVDPAELRRRAGVALVGRATGPFRNQSEDWRRLTRERLQLAQQWVASHAPVLD